jgi:hypothetical protein
MDSSLLQEITKLGPASLRGVRLEERERDFFLAAMPEPERISQRLQALSARSLVERSRRAGLRRGVGGGGDRAGLRLALG